MKNLLFLGVIALLLFGLSAALSLWLNQTRTSPDAAEDKKALKPDAPKGDAPKGGDQKTTTDPKDPPKSLLPPTGSLPGVDVAADQDKLARKAVQISLVLQDVQQQREATDALLREVTTVLKTATKNAELDAKKIELDAKKNELSINEKANYEKLAKVYDAMSPEGAAPILKQMAESGPGKLEQAAQILALMKERNAANLLVAMSDPPLADQLMGKMRTLRALNAPATAPPPSTPVGVLPVRGP